ncbi:MAG: tRNA (adenosine(37)-N6)-threonylcarbamoyltransferase complex dimerization subunit type 1 TsaB [Thermomicrobiales bacterium]|nr:tRNA (adenosine(37)-N6)-threonylcarbamoyltransferase complex dimerization subunit type 1 TsaB [Thermomicrobiales bacterium]MCO5217568.1 tRNA (adenosine(37)-N6)-threonylcarbamoyltransferase complex dimerization subunit type 1 TsaB [Thermomicrobiales bacterium]MCO5224126.1 tRNA (adenosine(37)-N6)-threonylcarbamoyltransferase complex dimerization subunit type 1 TsaB [Thermomicrobiales bacterium]MCO5226961.1 tRNA (adenosine(37)-N6)-threonylcarbamoyltransferase complex dimerization subunit type 1 
MQLPTPEQAIPPGCLAIDTSTDSVGIALSTTDGVVSRTWLANRAQTTTVLPEIDSMLAEHSMHPGDISGLVVATGPGTFTGLRVGLAIAKGIVAALSVPLAGVSTLDIVMAAHPENDLVAVLPAGRGRVVSKRRNAEAWNTTVDELLTSLVATPETLLIGELPEQFAPQIIQAHVRVINEPRDPAVLLRIGAARIASGDLDDPVTLEPTYLHGVTVNAPVIEDRLKRS